MLPDLGSWQMTQLVIKFRHYQRKVFFAVDYEAHVVSTTRWHGSILAAVMPQLPRFHHGNGERVLTYSTVVTILGEAI